MIETSCECGAALNAPESCAGKTYACEKCKAKVSFVCAETLPDGGGAGDFDAHLLIVAGPDRIGEQFLLGGVAEISIGKVADRNIILQGKKVSRGHCKLTRVNFGPSRWELHDNSSTNGLFINDQPVLSQELKNQDTIRVGEYELKYISTYERDLKAAQSAARSAALAAGGVSCPSCGNVLGKGAKICVNCGVDVKSGRSLIISKGLNEDDIAIRADTWIRTLSWFIPFGLFPIASEAFGTKKPVSTWVIFILTTVASVAFLVAAIGAGDEPSEQLLSVLQWNGDPQYKSPALLAMRREVEERVKQSKDEAQATPGNRPQRSGRNVDPKQLDRLMRQLAEEGGGDTAGEFRWYQLFTSALLHEPQLIMPFVLHLGGNMLFLLVFGLRVNELIGNLKSAIIYPILAAGSGLAHHIATMHGPVHPSLGASGAVMGLAGMYFIFFPVQRVHMAIWLRGGMLTRWQCFYKVFTMRGFWLLALWIGLNDVVPVFFDSRDQVAHWAHLGGFALGALIAIGLLLSRQISAHGSDILSVVLGKRAWALIGKPAAQMA